jgi:glycosyltransferase involved in cell wall biosynthesis
MKLVLALYRLALKKSFRIFFQNNDDKELFLSYRLARPSQIDVLPGSGVNLEVFKPAPMPVGHPTRFLLVARMLWDKGVGEFVDAAKALRNKGLQAEFCLLGFTDVANPAAIKSTQIEEWVKQGFVKYLGSTDDVKEEIQKSHCVVLPSYREGTPRALLEAAAMARPIVTTIAVGCKEVVDDGISGFLCPPKDSLGLAHKMELICNMGFEAKKEMGLLGRKKMEREYDEKIVIHKYLNALQGL